MLKPEQKEILEQLGASHFGKVLREYLDDAEKELDSVKGCTSLDEVLGKQYALAVLAKLFSFMKEKETPKSKTQNYV